MIRVKTATRKVLIIAMLFLLALGVTAQGEMSEAEQAARCEFILSALVISLFSNEHVSHATTQFTEIAEVAFGAATNLAFARDPNRDAAGALSWCLVAYDALRYEVIKHSTTTDDSSQAALTAWFDRISLGLPE